MNRKLNTDELGRPSVDEFAQQQKIPLVVVLDDVRSLANVGSVFRTADAFAVQHLYLCGITGTPPHREIQKTALGATESVSWSYAQDIVAMIKKMRSEGYVVAALEQTAESHAPDQIPWNGEKPLVLVIGNEVMGVKQEVVDLSDFVMEIPQIGTKHSLNVAVASGIAIWECFKRVPRS